MVKQCGNPECEQLFEGVRNQQYCSPECAHHVASKKLKRRREEKPDECLEWKLKYIQDHLKQTAETISDAIKKPVDFIMKICDDNGWPRPLSVPTGRKNEQRKILIPDPPKKPIKRVPGVYSNQREFTYYIARL